MKTFSVQTLGCKVNQYESDALAALLEARGLVQAAPGDAELRIVNTCSVTVQAGSKSRQARGDWSDCRCSARRPTSTPRRLLAIRRRSTSRR